MSLPSPGHDIRRTCIEIRPDGRQVMATDLIQQRDRVLVHPGGHDPPAVDPRGACSGPAGQRARAG
jgi:hypothetical protein